MSGNVNVPARAGATYATGPSNPGVTTTSLAASLGSKAPGVVQGVTPLKRFQVASVSLHAACLTR